MWLAECPGPAGVALLGKRRWARPREVPFVQRAGRAGRCTLSELAADFLKSPIPWIDPLEFGTLELGDWSPVLASESARAAYARLLGRAFERGTARLAKLRRENQRALALKRHRARPAEDPSRRWSEFKVDVPGNGGRRAVATLRSVAEGGAADVTVLIDGRVFGEFVLDGVLPLRLMLELPAARAVGDDTGRTRAAGALVASGPSHLVRSAPRDAARPRRDPRRG